MTRRRRTVLFVVAGFLATAAVASAQQAQEPAGSFDALAGCTVGDADRELGPPLDDDLLGGMFGGEPTMFRRYPATDAAPRGITCWFLDDDVVGVEIREAVPETDVLARLGPPDLVLESGLGSTYVQEVWAGRGLVLHRRGDVVRLALGLAEIDPEAWPSDPLSGWAEVRIRR
jgi:hypothetical protein